MPRGGGSPQIVSSRVGTYSAIVMPIAACGVMPKEVSASAAAQDKYSTLSAIKASRWSTGVAGVNVGVVMRTSIRRDANVPRVVDVEGITRQAAQPSA